jgi:arylsulfatase A-like enzyme
LAGVLVGHGWFFARGVYEYPQLYSAHLYERGAVRRALMVLLTDYATPAILDGALAILLAALLARPAIVAARRRPKFFAAAAAAVLTLAGAIALAARHRPAAASKTIAASDRPNVLVIAVDSLRADRLFGAGAERFPAMAGLAARGVRFREAYVTQARTFPSFVTLLTGRWPHHHGIRHEFPPAAARRAIGPSLPDALRSAGVRTAVVTDFAGEIFARTPIGFDDVDAPLLDLYAIVEQQIVSAHPSVLPYVTSRAGQALFPSTRSMAELNDPALLAARAEAELDRLAGGPFFLTVFFSASHSPYVGPAPYYRRFADAHYRGPFRYLKQPLPQLPALPPVEARQVQALYDGALAATDDAVARLLRRLDEHGLTRRTVVVLLGDHGENLFDVPGRGMGHGDHLWGSLANHIPLVIVDPARAPRDVDGVVRDVDLAPTLARLTGVAPPPSDGVDLAPLLDGARGSLDLDAYAETGLWLLESGPGYRRDDRLPYPNLWNATEAAADGDVFLQPRWERPAIDAKYRSLRSGAWKLVYQPAPDGAHWRLFDLIIDPAEQRDVAAAHPVELTALRTKLTTWITSDGTKLLPDAP